MVGQRKLSDFYSVVVVPAELMLFLHIFSAIQNKLFVIIPENPSVEAVAKVFYNVWFFWVVGKAYFSDFK